jgi:DNA repair protein RadC
MSDNNSPKPHYHDHRKRLREHFIKNGLEGLKDYEVVELLLTYAIPYKDVKESAKEAIKKFGNVKGIFDAEEEELQKIPYFKDSALSLRKFILEVAKLYHYQTAKATPISLSKKDLLDHCMKKLYTEKVEQFWVISLNSRLSIINEDMISKGLIDKALVYPRQIIETAMKNAAYSILLLHNHPNGNPQPSAEDITITKAIDIPAKLLNMSVYDHIIVAGEKHYSFKDNDLI